MRKFDRCVLGLLAILIDLVATAGVMALGAQTAAAAPHDTKVTITQDRSPPPTLIHG